MRRLISRGTEAHIPTPFSSLDLPRRLALRHELLRALRGFFDGRGYVEVETPLAVTSPGIDPYIDALAVGGGLYLATSPELQMKRLVASGCRRIYQLTRSFRAGERGRLHNPEFSMLEWYAAGLDYGGLMGETEALVREAAARLEAAGLATPAGRWPSPFVRLTVDEAFARWAGWRPADSFDADRFFLDLIERVEPRLAEAGAVFLHDFPVEVGSLARRKAADPRLAERFELYLNGLEICNGFGELTDPVEQRERFERHNRERRAMGKEAYPLDEKFLAALRKGLPSCSGNALGVDRLMMALSGAGGLGEVMAFPAERL